LTAAVTGATGYVGRFIVDRLIGEGVSVRAWRRQNSDLRGMPSGIQWTDGDLSSPQAADALLEGADMLVHAALDHQAGRYRGGEGGDLAGYLQTNVAGSLALLAKAREDGVKRCVVISSRAVFGEAARTGPLADEEPPRPDTHYGAAKAALEAFVQSLGHEGWPIAALRPTGVYGVVVPAEKSKWFDLVARALSREPVESRAGTEVHGRDVAEAVWRLLTAPPGEVGGRAFNCSDIVVSTRDIVRLVHRTAEMSGPLPKPAPVPVNVMSHEGLDRLGVVFGGRPLFQATVERLVVAVQAKGAGPIKRQSGAG
jgi:nucleoside-diphosphate-sugar epimerase